MSGEVRREERREAVNRPAAGGFGEGFENSHIQAVVGIGVFRMPLYSPEELLSRCIGRFHQTVF